MDGGEMVAGLPGILLNFKMIRILYASIPYGNMIGDPAYFPAFMNLLDREFEKKGIDQVRITESPFSKSYQPASFKPLVAKCTLLDLRGFDKDRIGDGYRSEVRRAVRKAKKNGLSVRGLSSKEEVEIFYRLYLSSMERNRAMAKYPRQWFHAVFEILVHQKRGDILFALKDKNEYAAGVVVIYSPISCHYLHNGSVKTYLESRPNDLIVDHIIQEGVKEGKVFLDFMGSDPQDLSLIRFKEKWGSQSVDIKTYVEDYHPLRCGIWELGKRAMNSSVVSWLFRKIRG
jgi:lipid II:glycine glycyltransferase (peptidoglycan interpeptide bridge formation enzyme)